MPPQTASTGLAGHAPLSRMTGLSTLTLVLGLAAGCASLRDEPIGPARKETAYAVTVSNQLIAFNAGQPQLILSKQALTGLQAGESVVGIDYRVARGQLYALSSAGRLLRIDTQQAAVQPIGQPIDVVAGSAPLGFDFNPTVDRIRVVDPSGRNLRLHPDTGAVVDSDPQAAGTQADGRLAYEPGDAAAGRQPHIVAAAYTYNKVNEKLTTNYAIDALQGTLVMQGTREGATPAVSPNTGRLTTVGKLGVPAFSNASLDIADLSNAAFLATDSQGDRESRWYGVDLVTGKATYIGSIRTGEVVRGIAIEP